MSLAFRLHPSREVSVQVEVPWWWVLVLVGSQNRKLHVVQYGANVMVCMVW